MTGKEKVHHITASAATFTEFDRMAQSYGLTNKGLLEMMVAYFRVSKADPRDPKADNPTDAIKALEKSLRKVDEHIISFIKVQEKDTLEPMKKILIELSKMDADTGVVRRKQARRIYDAIEALCNYHQIKIN